MQILYCLVLLKILKHIVLIYNKPKPSKMKLHINKYILSFIFTGLIFILIPTTTYANEISIANKYFGITQQKNVITYEKSQPSSIDNPVVDPNFNTMRSKDTESSTATYIVIGLLIAATIIPLATWWYFSK